MPSAAQLLSVIDQTYRNSYSTALKVTWMNTVQTQIFQLVPKEAAPYKFLTIQDQSFYPLPEDCDRFGIKSVTIENSPGKNTFEQLPYVSIESTADVGRSSHFYTLQQDLIFINPKPEANTDNKTVYVIYNKRPGEISTTTLDNVPDLEEDFQELLILGTLERIARARGEIEDKNNFAADYNVLLDQYRKMYKLRQPTYYSVNDVMPRTGSLVRGRKRNRGNRFLGSSGSTVADLIPPGL